jgi:hypothetical protein
MRGVSRDFATAMEVATRQGHSLMEAAIDWAEKNGHDLEVVAEMMKKNQVMVARLEEEAEELNFLRKTARLPV